MSNERTVGFVGPVNELIVVARGVSPEALVGKIGAQVLVGPSVIAQEQDDDEAGWSFETRMTGSAPSPMLSGSWDTHVVYALRKAHRAFFQNVIMVGRAATNDVVLEDASISKLHARLKVVPNGRFLISDADSTHGTYVGQHRLIANEEREVGHGDAVRFGDRPFQIFDTERLHTVLARMIVLPE